MSQPTPPSSFRDRVHQRQAGRAEAGRARAEEDAARDRDYSAPLAAWLPAHDRSFADLVAAVSPLLEAGRGADVTVHAPGIAAALAAFRETLAAHDAIPGVSALKGLSPGHRRFGRCDVPIDPVEEAPAGLLDRLARADIPGVRSALAEFGDDEAACLILSAGEEGYADAIYATLADPGDRCAFGAVLTLAEAIRPAPLPGEIENYPHTLAFAAGAGGPMWWPGRLGDPATHLRVRRLTWLARRGLSDVPSLWPLAETFPALAAARELGKCPEWIEDDGRDPDGAMGAAVTPAPDIAVTGTIAVHREQARADAPPVVRPDGPREPSEFWWGGHVRHFMEGENTLYRLLLVTWPSYLRDAPLEVRAVNDDLDARGGSKLEVVTLRNYCRKLSGILTGVGVPRQLKVVQCDGRDCVAWRPFG